LGEVVQDGFQVAFLNAAVPGVVRKDHDVGAVGAPSLAAGFADAELSAQSSDRCHFLQFGLEFHAASASATRFSRFLLIGAHERDALVGNIRFIHTLSFSKDASYGDIVLETGIQAHKPASFAGFGVFMS